MNQNIDKNETRSQNIIIRNYNFDNEKSYQLTIEFANTLLLGIIYIFLYFCKQFQSLDVNLDFILQFL